MGELALIGAVNQPSTVSDTTKGNKPTMSNGLRTKPRLESSNEQEANRRWNPVIHGERQPTVVAQSLVILQGEIRGVLGEISLLSPSPPAKPRTLLDLTHSVLPSQRAASPLVQAFFSDHLLWQPLHEGFERNHAYQKQPGDHDQGPGRWTNHR